MIEQSLSQAPLGLEALMGDSEPVMEIEIETPDGLQIDMDGMVIEAEEEREEGSFDENLADVLDDGTLARVFWLERENGKDISRELNPKEDIILSNQGELEEGTAVEPTLSSFGD
jgi:hypothetical protein